MIETIHSLLNECKPISEEDANKIVNELSVLFNDIGLIFSPIGSFNKKVDGSFYNDIDIAVEAPYDAGIEIIKKVCSDKNDILKFGKVNYKFNTVSVGYKINENNYAQVDFMFCNNLEYAKFAFHSPNFKNNESKYKGMFASVLLQSIIKNIPVHKEYFDDGSVKEYVYFSLSQKDGLLRKHKTFVGKKGNKVKSPRLIEETFISDDPNFIVNLIFKDNDAFNYIYTFEGLLEYASKKYDKKFLERVKHDFLTDWELELKTPNVLKKEFEYLFEQKINNL